MATWHPQTPGVDSHLLAELRVRQHGVVSRRQLCGDVGAHDHDIARLIRRRDLTPVHAGVYVDHTGPLTWEQRAWAAVLAAWPAALCHDSALPGAAIGSPEAGIHIAVDRHRAVRPLAGVRVHHLSHLSDRVDWLRSPPRVRVADAVLDVCTAKTDVLGKYQVLAEACQSRATTPAHLELALAQRQRMQDRALLEAMLDDLRSGACSVLEREYLALERRHGLPHADRQRSGLLPAGPVYRDATYAAYGVVVELMVVRITTADAIGTTTSNETWTVASPMT